MQAWNHARPTGVGVIDSDYRGEVRVGLCNVSDAAYTIQPLDRIAQLVMLELPRYAVEEVERTTDTARGAGGSAQQAVKKEKADEKRQKYPHVLYIPAQRHCGRRTDFGADAGRFVFELGCPTARPLVSGSPRR